MELYKSGTIGKIRDKYDFRFSKSLGQNFLTDGNIINKIVEESFVNEKSLVIEIGPGMGALTEMLAEKAGHVIAIELDKRLIPILRENFENKDNVSIIQGDILKTDLEKIIKEESERLNFIPSDIRIVGNLPYYITTPIIMKILEEKIPAASITVMMQKEVGDRIMAKPGSKAYGALTLAVKYYCTVENIAKAPKEVFMPRPKVDSTVLRLDIRKEKPVELVSEDIFFEVIRSGFAQRRKTMNNSLAGVSSLGKDKIEKILKEIGIDGGRRAETLDIKEFALIANGIWENLERE